MMGYDIYQRGRYPDGRKRRWTRAQKSAAKRARVEEWLSIARQWKKQKKEETREEESTTPIWGGVGKWVEELPWELWELVFDNLSVVDRLVCITSAKVLIERYEKGVDLAILREEAREEVQTAREERYAQRVRAAVDYFIINNIQLRQPGVSYRNVAKQFRIGKPSLQEGVEIYLDYCRNGDEDTDED